MTIHKSNGLEYHFVVFVGLKDTSFCCYTNQRDEDRNDFFIALSRAKKGAYQSFVFRCDHIPRQGLPVIVQVLKYATPRLWTGSPHWAWMRL